MQRRRIRRLLCKMLVVALSPFRNLGPSLRRTKKDVAKMMTIGADPARIIEGSGVDEPYPGTPFKCETDVSSAPRAKLNVEPASRHVRDMPVPGEWPAGDLDLLVVEDRFHCERRSGSSLAPRAVTDRYPERIALRNVAHASADATSGMRP